MAIAPEELAQFRSESGLNQSAMAELLNDVLGMHYSGSTISAWEREHKPIPRHVQSALEDMIISAGGSVREDSPADDGEIPGADPQSRRPDLPPRFDSDTRIVPVPVPAGNMLQSAATEMFQGIGMGLEMAGAFIGGPKVIDSNGDGKVDISLLEQDGRIIAADAEKLGRAWAHLAEQNAWVARIIGSMTSGGAWVEVIMATSGTVFAVYQNHAGYAKFLQEQSRLTPTPEPEPAEDGSVI